MRACWKFLFLATAVRGGLVAAEGRLKREMVRDSFTLFILPAFSFFVSLNRTFLLLKI